MSRLPNRKSVSLQYLNLGVWPCVLYTLTSCRQTPLCIVSWAENLVRHNSSQSISEYDLMAHDQDVLQPLRYNTCPKDVIVQVSIIIAIASLPHTDTPMDGMAQALYGLIHNRRPSMTLLAAQRAVMTARTSQGFSYTLKAPYVKAMQRYMQRPHAHSFLTLPCCRSCSTLPTLKSCLQKPDVTVQHGIAKHGILLHAGLNSSA